MNIRKKVDAVFFSDIRRALSVALRYAFGRGATQKQRRFMPAERKIPAFSVAKCTGCRLCVQICPTQAVFVQTKLNREKSPDVTFRLDDNRCVSCGLCVEACPEDALDFKGKSDHVCR